MGCYVEVNGVEAWVGFGTRASLRLPLVTSELLNQLFYALPGMQFRCPARRSVTIIGPFHGRSRASWNGDEKSGVHSPDA
jgi:hypothetical protein